MARYLINTSNVNQLTQFYINLGFDFKKVGKKSTLLKYPNSPDILINDISENNEHHLEKLHFEIYPNISNIYINSKSINSLKEICNTHNIKWELEENNFEIKLKISDPISNKLLFKQKKDLSDKRIMFLYENSKGLLMQLFSKLDKEDIKLMTTNSNWTILITLNHVIEVESYNFTIIKYALAESGRDYNSNLYDCDIWAEKLKYSNLIPIEILGNYFLSQREYMSYLLENNNYPLDNYLMNNNQVIKIRDILTFIASHTMEHVLEIQKIIDKKGVKING